MGTELPLRNMHRRHHGLSPGLAKSFFEAACVCLDRHHIPPVCFDLNDGTATREARLNWKKAGERLRDAWANQTDTTEYAAYAVALAATEVSKGLYAIRRAETLTGADYYVAPADQDRGDLEGCFRLEVSGTNSSRRSYVTALLDQKLEQAAAGKSNLPALAAVVGFACKSIQLAALESK